VWEQGGSSEKAPVVDLSSSSDEGDLIVDVSWEEEFTRRLFGDFNCDVLGPPNDDKIIILSDSDEEEEVHEEKATDVEAAPSSPAWSTASTTSVDAEATPSSTVRSPSSTASIDNASGTYKSNTPDRVTDGYSSGGDKANLP
jgi:hypothetical protein